MAIKMRINNDKESRCFNCRTEWRNTGEMYDFAIGYKEKQKIIPLCRNCVEEIFNKTLKASTKFNAKVKSKEDMKRIQRECAIRNNGFESISLNKALKGIKIKGDENE